MQKPAARVQCETTFQLTARGITVAERRRVAMETMTSDGTSRLTAPVNGACLVVILCHGG